MGSVMSFVTVHILLSKKMKAVYSPVETTKRNIPKRVENKHSMSVADESDVS